MNQWAFVIAAYSLVGVGTAGLVLGAYLSLRRAEAKAEAVKRRP